MKRAEVDYEVNLEKTFFIEDLYLNKNASDRKIHSKLNILRQGTCGSCMDKISWYWYIVFKPKIFYLISMGCAILSLMIVIGELCVMLQLDISIFETLQEILGILGANFLSFFVLLYLSLCVYYGFFNLKIYNIYSFHPH